MRFKTLTKNLFENFNVEECEQFIEEESKNFN